jgi:DNA-binding FrmR family transcriptional regulator
MQETVKDKALKRLSYLSGHLDGVRRMIEADTYCVDVLKQTHAVRRAIEKLEAVLLEGHLHTCVPDAIREGRENEVVGELVQLYAVANR